MMKTFIVLGMHRSATSLAAKGLHESGVWMGEDLIGVTPSNPYGHYENRRFVQLNCDILQKAGGSWDRPPSKEKIISAGKALSDRIKQTIEMESSGHKLWGWKDPRNTLTIDCYWPHLQGAHLIVCFRNPVEVAASLSKRDGFSLAKGLGLANEYNKRLMEFLNRQYLTGAAIVTAKRG